VSVPVRLRAPSEDEAVVADPPLSAVASLLTDNRRRLTSAEPTICGRPWSDLRRAARQNLVEAAKSYFTSGREPLPSLPSLETDCPIFMAGHQPELFHPGVWVKNFALSGLSRTHGGIAVNLVVDNDTVKSTALRVPSCRDGRAQVVTVAFDTSAEGHPHEERTVRDEALFASFPERVNVLTKAWNFEPLLPRYWRQVMQHARQTPLLGERFARARRELERAWGCHNLELPVSVVCQSEAFSWFACELLANLPRFQRTYNDSVHEYRRRYGIRSTRHPVPDLATDDGWLEAPFWAWQRGQTRRGRLFVKVEADRVRLRVGNDDWPSLPRASRDSSLSSQPTVAAWHELERRGFKVRSRALTNTLFARMFLCDLFVHGIGGGKYDELTDAIMQRHYGIEPPRYLVLSATLLLPLPTLDAKPEQCQSLAQQARDMHWNPQRHLSDRERASTSVQQWTTAKRDWIARVPADRLERHQRWQELRTLTERLRKCLENRDQEMLRQAGECRERVQANAVTGRRDYAFCLYPEEKLKALCRRFL
jgi:hypothetical protein